MAQLNFLQTMAVSRGRLTLRGITPQSFPIRGIAPTVLLSTTKGAVRKQSKKSEVRTQL